MIPEGAVVDESGFVQGFKDGVWKRVPYTYLKLLPDTKTEGYVMDGRQYEVFQSGYYR